MAGKKTTRGKRYSQAQKEQILSTAKREGLTGAQVRKRFGVSTLTFYRWRGPVRRGRAKAASGPARSGRKAGSDGLRDQVRQTVRNILPGVIRSEVNSYLDELLGRRGPGRPRKGT